MFERLRRFPYLDKGFITAQIVRDLKQVEPLRSASDWNTFVRSGPGSQRGVNRILGAEIARERPEAEWRSLFQKIVALAAPRVAEHGIELDAQSWQNVLCETDKFLRYRSGDFGGARRYAPGGKAPPRARKAKPTPAPALETPVPASIQPIEMPHARPELAAARDPTAPHVLLHDLETRSPVDLKTAGAWKYAADPATEVMCLAYAVDNEPTQLWVPGDPVPPEFIEAANNPNWIVVAHNDSFERAIAQHVLLRHGFPAIPLTRRRCSMAMALAMALPAKLDAVARALELRHQKDAIGHRLMLMMAKPRKGGDPKQVVWFDDPDRLGRLYEYCRQDVETERELFTRLQPLSPAEQALWELDAIINQRGFCIDRDLAEAAHKIAQAAAPEIDAELAEVTGGAVTAVNQLARLQAWLQQNGCAVKDLQRKTVATPLESESSRFS